MRYDACAKQLIIRQLALTLFGLGLTAVFTLPIRADEFTFTVVHVSSGSVLLKSEVECSAGTLINMSRPDASNHFVTLKVLAKRGRGLYVAIPEFDDVNLAQLKDGDTGTTDSLLQNYDRTPVIIESNDSKTSRQLEEILREQYAAIIKIEKSKLTSDTIELHVEKENHNRTRFAMKSPLGEVDDEREIGDLVREVVATSKSIVWLGLNNPFLLPRHSTVQFIKLGGSGGANQESMRLGTPFDMQITSYLPSSYVCVLKLDTDGKIRVLFPNDRPDSKPDARFLPMVARLLGDSSGLILTPDKPGPVNVVALFSTVPRPISSFLPRSFLGTFLSWDGKNEINPSAIGPGYSRTSLSGETSSMVEDSPETWDVAAGVLFVSP